MIKIIRSLVVLALGAATTATAQNERVLAKVQSIDGKQVYVLNEPLREYEVLGEVNTGIKFISLMTRGIISEDIAEKSTQFTRKAIRKYEKKSIDFDAVVYSNGRKAKVIRFLENKDTSREGVAVVNELNGVYQFVLAEPLFTFETESNVKNYFSLRSFLTNGFWNNSIEQDAKYFAKKAIRKDNAATYITYDSGRQATIITQSE